MTGEVSSRCFCIYDINGVSPLAKFFDILLEFLCLPSLIIFS